MSLLIAFVIVRSNYCNIIFRKPRHHLTKIAYNKHILALVGLSGKVVNTSGVGLHMVKVLIFGDASAIIGCLFCFRKKGTTV